jgi:hypothetical protein
MPTRSDHAAAADALHQVFLVNLIAEPESQLCEEGFDSEYSFRAATLKSSSRGSTLPSRFSTVVPFLMSC